MTPTLRMYYALLRVGRTMLPCARGLLHSYTWYYAILRVVLRIPWFCWRLHWEVSEGCWKFLNVAGWCTGRYGGLLQIAQVASPAPLPQTPSTTPTAVLSSW